MIKKNKSNMDLFTEYTKISSTDEKVRFLHDHFWANMKLDETNLKLVCDDVVARGSLVLNILQDALIKRDLRMAYEASLVCTSFTQSKLEASKQIIENHNLIVERLAPVKFVEVLKI